jgi:hypothetical protein
VSSPAATAPAPLLWVGTRLARGRAWILSLRTTYVLGFLCVVQALALLAFAVTVRHNGWLYYAGGDQLWHYSGAYLMTHGHLPPSFVGYGWTILLLPIAVFAGPNLVSALPAIVLFNQLVLLPLALLCVYGIGSRTAGRLFGYFAAVVWIALPYIGILFVEPGYHQKYTELTLPQLLGLTPIPDFAAMVALLLSAYLCLRALDSSGWHSTVGAGFAAGYSIAIKPSNAIFLFAPAALLLVKRWTALPLFVAGLSPALITLAVWKYRGLGQLAAAPAEPVRLAAGPDDLMRRIFSPRLNTWDHLRDVLEGLREHFWVARVLEWLPVAGGIALLLRSIRAFLLIGTWFTAFLLLKGTYIPASLDDASFFRLLMPAFPAFVLLTAATVLLVPGVRARPDRPGLTLTSRGSTIVLTLSLLVLGVLPLSVIAATPRLHDGGADAVREAASLVPVSSDLRPRVTTADNTVRLEWQRAKAPPKTAIFYRILRAQGNGAGTGCAHRRGNASDDCRLYMDAVGATRTSTFTDRPPPGTWTYRIGTSANWLNDFAYGDVYVASTPVTVTIP